LRVFSEKGGARREAGGRDLFNEEYGVKVAGFGGVEGRTKKQKEARRQGDKETRRQRNKETSISHNLLVSPSPCLLVFLSNP
jgi:hypothetical protein